MRVSILSSLWTGYLASQLPCHPDHLIWTRQHIIPRSFPLNKQITDSPHNIIPMPQLIKNAREDYPYTNEWQGGQAVYACSNCPNPGFCRAAAVVSASGKIYPPDVLKGPIARSVLHTVNTSPKIAEVIDELVLDLNTAIEWDSKFPMSRQEKVWFDSL